MRVAGGEKATRLCEVWILLDREAEVRHRLIEAPAKEMRYAHCKARRPDSGARAEPQRRLEMLDRNVGPARPIPEGAADVPAACVIRIERQGTVNQLDHYVDILAEIGKRMGCIREDARIVARHFQGLPCELGALQAVRLPIFAAIVTKQPKTALRGPGERGPVTRVARNRLLQQTERFWDLPWRRPDHFMSAQVEIVCCKVGRGATGRMCGFRRLQGRLEDAGDARSDLVLKVEDIFQRPIEMIRPQMRPGTRVDQLTGNADPITAPAHRPFEQVTDTQFLADPLHIDVLALIRKSRIAGGNKQPADAREGGNDLLDHAVSEIFLLRVTAEIVERQDRERRFVRG